LAAGLRAAGLRVGLAAAGFFSADPALLVVVARVAGAFAALA
jgi:hypothetical protein